TTCYYSLSLHDALPIWSEANFWAGFCGIGLLWLSTAVVIDITSSADLADKVASLMHLNKTLLIIVSALIGALVGGMASYTGSLEIGRAPSELQSRANLV